MISVPVIPDNARWSPTEQQQAARVLALQLTEQVSEYGSGVVLRALEMALVGDLAPVAEQCGRLQLACCYRAAGISLQAMCTFLSDAETFQQPSTTHDQRRQQ